MTEECLIVHVRILYPLRYLVHNDIRFFLKVYTYLSFLSFFYTHYTQCPLSNAGIFQRSQSQNALEMSVWSKNRTAITVTAHLNPFFEK